MELFRQSTILRNTKRKIDCLRNIKQVVTIKNALTIISSFLVKMRSDKKLSAAK